MTEQVIEWRRTLHRHPEIGWTEFQTTRLVVGVLKDLGFQVKYGAEVVNRETRIGLPDEKTLAFAKERALANGVEPEFLAELEDGLTGGCRGAKAMVDAGVVDGVDYFLSGHLGSHARRNRMIACSTYDFLASTKMDVTLHGVPTHAAMSPQEGRNALLAAATIALQVHAITRHGDGMSRVNVGVLQAGEGRNIIASQAKMQLETRGSTNEINEFMTEEAMRIIKAAAEMHGVRSEVAIVGQAISAPCDDELVDLVAEVAAKMEPQPEIVRALPLSGSEDATYLMEAVQKQGGKATYVMIGSELAAGHHNSAFDFCEESLPFAVELYSKMLLRLV